MVKPLSFKGDKKPSKKRKRDKHDHESPTSSSLAVTTSSQQTRDQDPDLDKPSGPEPQPRGTAADNNDDNEDDSWVTADTPLDVSGPIIIVLPTSPPTCLASDANGSVFASPLPHLRPHADADASSPAPLDPLTAEPHDVRQVWVATRVAGSERLFSLKGHHGRYLGSDRVGLLSATREAVSPEETFTLLNPASGRGFFALQTVRETFVGVDAPASGDAEAAPERIRLRGDLDAAAFASTLRVRMQARFKPRLKKLREERRREKISRKELEAAVGRALADDEVKRLKRARRDGDYHEALLDVKVKGKHDKFA